MTTLFVKSADGVRIAYEVRGEGPALCLLHGFSGDRAVWSEYRWIERLRSQFTVITPDLRGCGESDAPLEPLAYSVEAHCADVAAVANVCGFETLLVWGWSFGATVGLHMAAALPCRVEKAVIAGTYFGRIFTPEYVDQRLAHASSLVECARWEGMVSWAGIAPADLCCPTLLCTGTGDGNVVVQLERQRNAIEEVGMRLHVFEGFKHGQLISRQDEVAGVVLPFLIGSVS